MDTVIYTRSSGTGILWMRPRYQYDKSPGCTTRGYHYGDPDVKVPTAASGGLHNRYTIYRGDMSMTGLSSFLRTCSKKRYEIIFEKGTNPALCLDFVIQYALNQWD